MANFSKKKMVGFFLTGAAVGAAVALLYAPKAGAHTRRDIRKFSKRAVDRLDDLQCDVREQLNGGYEQVIEVFDNVKDYVEDGKNRLKKMMQTA